MSEYEAKYTQQHAELTAGRLGLPKFQQNLKPKRIFESFQDPRAETAYKEFWAGSDTFLTVKGLIAQRCRDIGLAGGDPFEHVLNHVNLAGIPELVQKRDLLLGLIAG